MKIHVHYHAWLNGRWRPIVAEQILLFVSSGLYDAAESIAVTLLAIPEQAAMFVEMIKPFKKFTIVFQSTIAEKFEFPAIDHLFDEAWLTAQITPSEPFASFYLHSKGVSRHNDAIAQWRDVLNNGLIREWREHYRALCQGSDVSGPQYLPHVEGKYPQHFSGNFWAAHSHYIARLVNPRNLGREDRYQAEWWICSGSPHVNSLPWQETNQY